MPTYRFTFRINNIVAQVLFMDYPNRDVARREGKIMQAELVNLRVTMRCMYGVKRCKRCNGAGYFPKYSHVNGGVCMRCNGTGVEP